MTKAELREKIKSLAVQIMGERSQADDAALAYDELTKFPELKEAIVNLMTHEFNNCNSSYSFYFELIFFEFQN